MLLSHSQLYFHFPSLIQERTISCTVMAMALGYARTTKITILTITAIMMTMILSHLATYGTFSAGGRYLHFSGHMGCQWVSFILQDLFLAYMFVCFVAGAAGAAGVAVLGWLTLGEMSPVKPMRL